MAEDNEHSFLKGGRIDRGKVESLLSSARSRLPQTLKEAQQIRELRAKEGKLATERAVDSMASQVSLAVSLTIEGEGPTEDELLATIVGITGQDREDRVRKTIFGVLVPELGKAFGEYIASSESLIQRMAGTEGLEDIGEDSALIPAVLDRVVERQCGDANQFIDSQRARLLFGGGGVTPDQVLAETREKFSWLSIARGEKPGGTPLLELTRQDESGQITKSAVKFDGATVGLWKKDKKSLSGRIELGVRE